MVCSEFRAIVGDHIADTFLFVSSQPSSSDELRRSVLCDLFSQVMRSAANDVRQQLSSLLPSLSSLESRTLAACPNQKPNDLDVSPLILRLAKQYPGDVGIFAPFFLNCFQLAPGEAIFLGPNEPHAYLDGDCVEAMACSDNVVRAGLTPKLRDVDTLCSMLTYKAMYPSIDRGQPLDEHSVCYVPPVEEFCVIRTVLPARSAAPYTLTPLPDASVLLVYSGHERVQLVSQTDNGRTYVGRTGVTLLLSGHAVVQVLLTGETTSNAPLVLFRCSRNHRFATSTTAPATSHL